MVLSPCPDSTGQPPDPREPSLPAVTPCGGTAAGIRDRVHCRWITGWPKWPELTVRMRLHIGEAAERDGNYFGPAPGPMPGLNRTLALTSW